MSDEETVCSFMEMKPTEWAERREVSSEGWWQWKWSVMNQTYKAWPSDKVWSLDALHEVEASLNERQQQHYCVLTFQWNCKEARTSNAIEDTLTKNRWPMIHSTAEQKLKALAAVIRAQKENA